MDLNNRLLIFGMKNLLLEKALDSLEKSGIKIGHAETLEKNEVVDRELFESDINVKAQKMGDFYELYFCMENSIRRMICERLNERYGGDWWGKKVPDEVKKKVKRKQENELDTQISPRSNDPLDYTDFGELIEILDATWTDFADLLRSQNAVRQILGQFKQLRNVIAHSCELPDDEIIRFKLLINDWLRVQT